MNAKRIAKDIVDLLDKSVDKSVIIQSKVIAQRIIESALTDFVKESIAEHPADSDRPIDAAWLESIGFDPPDEDVKTYVTMTAKTASGTAEISVEKDEKSWLFAFEEQYLRDIETRGDLLRLMAALGIPPSAGAKGEL